MQKIIAVLGMFDGVHIGHQALLAAAGELREETGLPVVMVTFSVHPKSLLGAAPGALTDPGQKEELAHRYGADRVEFLPFDQAMRETRPKAFMEEILSRRLGAAYVVVGENYRFGYRHEGSADTLRQRSDLFRTVVIPSVQLLGEPVSSSRIRRLLEEGELSSALACLGHPLEIRGRVQAGRQVGRRLGFCTANLKGSFPPLRHGVYVTSCFAEGEWRPSVSNFGVLPTFGQGQEAQLECHLLSYEGDLYQQEITVRPEQFLRPERQFSAPWELARQVEQDIVVAKQYFGV